MKKIFSASQIATIDDCTIQKQNITSIDLMERASLAVYERLLQKLSADQLIYVFAGKGNNGGDGLAIARMLFAEGFALQVYIVESDSEFTDNCEENKNRLERLMPIFRIWNEGDIPSLPPDCVVLDCLFGVGLNRPLSGIFKSLVVSINNAQCGRVYSLDMPSGLFAGDNSNNDSEAIIKADEVFTFQFPKLSLLLPDSRLYSGSIEIIDIGLCEKCIADTLSSYYLQEREDLSLLIKPRNIFANKGDFGRAFIIAGEYGKMGAAVMSAKACLRTGVGLLTMHVPRCGVDVLQISVPEAMVDPDVNEFVVSEIRFDLSKYTVGIGPGLGVANPSVELLTNLLNNATKPLVIDADALNIIANNNFLKEKIPAKSILTPHPVEFERLVGCRFQTGYQRLQSAKELATDCDLYVVLKGAYTAIVSPDGNVFFNSSGNPGMATGGSGDVLTGIITSLLAQGYSPLDAARLGVYIHGFAGDLATLEKSQQAMIASDIIDKIGNVYNELKNNEFLIC